MRLPRWKKEQKKRKSRKTQYAIRKTLLVISAILLIGIGWKVYGSLSKSLWDGKSRLTLALDSTPILIASFDPGDKTLNLLSIPGETLIETIHGYGFYKAESIWQLAELEGYGGEFLAGSLQEYLGVPIDAYASVSSIKYQVSSIKTKDGFLAIIQSLLKDNGQTNLSRWDLIRLWWGIRGVRFDKARVFDFPDPLQLDSLISKLFVDQRIKKEKISIGVFNGTQYPGLAKKAARMINNIGGQVIEVGDWSERNAKCEVRSEKKLAGSYTAQKLMKIFDCQYGGSELRESGVEMVLITGENYWQRLMEK